MKKFYFFLFLLPVVTCYSQLNELHFNRLSIKNGLPEGVITTALQDKEGYIWIGTQAGLVRYDGYATKVFQFGIVDPLHATISSIYEDRSGELWIGTLYEGLYHYNRETDTFIHYKHDPKDPNSISTGNIISMHDDRNGNLWVLVADGFDFSGKHVNLFATKKHQFKQFGILEKGNHYINASVYYNLFEDSKGRMWIGTNNGIYEYTPSGDKFFPHLASADSSQQKIFNRLTGDAANPGIIWMSVWGAKASEGLLWYNTADNTVKIYHHIPNDSTSLGCDTITSIQKDSQGRMWFGSGYGLSRFEPSSERFINYNMKDRKTSFWENAIWQAAEDKEGNFWCNGGNDLLFFEDKTKTFKWYVANSKDPDALPARGITGLLIDRSGTPWVGTGPQGLYRVNRHRSKFAVYKNQPGQTHFFPGGSSTSFAEDKDGTFWVWSSHGLYHWYPSSDSFTLIKSLKDQLGENSWHISSILIDRKGIVWCGSLRRGLFSYNPKTRVTKNFKNNANDSTSLSSDAITTLFEDDKGTLWIGSFQGGLCSFNQQANIFKTYPHTLNDNNNSPNNHTLNDWTIYSICEDKDSDLWIGTNNGGISRFSRKTETFTSYQNQSPGTTITKIFKDSKGNIWVGTHASGLFLFDRKTNTFKKFSEKDGLLYNGVLSINEDNANNLWISSDRGISILNIQTNKISRLGTINGLPEDPDNGNFFKTSHARFLMAYDNGFISFDPEQLKPDTVVAILHIESIEITKSQTRGSKLSDSIIYDYGNNKIELRYNENRITFNYVGLQYQNSPLNQYAYKLEGYDKDWIQAGTQRKVTYTNLSPDAYIFRVKAANSDGVWNPEEQTITVIISPPWWRTWWAYTLYVIAFALAVWTCIAYRSRSLKRKNKILEEKVEDRTAQLTRSFEELKATQAQLIHSEKMASLGELTAGIAHEIQNPLNFVNNFSEVNDELIEEMNDENNISEIKSIANNIKQNNKKIAFHGKRAEAIVKGMLQHSRASSGIKEPTDINKLVNEYLRLAYHGLRAKDKSFNAEIKTEFDNSIGKINIVSQEISRVILNLVNNAFYAVNERHKVEDSGYESIVTVSTAKQNGKVEIKVKDNGKGIPQKILDKIFQPFFTTKPTGQGTGLGLSLAYDIVKAHGGVIKVETKEGEGSEFIVELPKSVQHLG